MKKTRFIPITSKVNTIIIFALIIGIGSIAFFLATEISKTTDDLLDQNLQQQSEILFSAIENFMIPGEAELAVEFFDAMRRNNEDYSIFLFRRDGELAFKDNATLEEMLIRIPALSSRFSTMAERITGDEVVIPEYFETAVGSPPESAFFEIGKLEEKRFSRVYRPLLNLPKCTGCHGADHTVRGVIDIRADITAPRMRQRNSIYLAGGFFAGLVILLAIILSQFMRRTIIKPVKTIGQVCSNVTEGNFEDRVSIKNRDEIGGLGATVNTMVEGLHERFELSKYVSTAAMNSLREKKEGHLVPMTMLFSDIRGFTSYSEKRSPEEVVKYLNLILNVQTEIIQKYAGDIDKYVGDEIVSMWLEENQAINSVKAAIEICEELQKHSNDIYDGLQVGIGINSGEVILGMIGSQKRADYTFIGDNVNTASRLCDAAKPSQILISSSTYDQIADSVLVGGPFRLKAKGKDEYVKVYLVEGLK
jgi:adenylate cyclase